MIFYFTGTGNSRYCAKLLAHGLGDRCVDSFSFIRDGIAPELTSEKPWVFVAPTYAWQLPRAFTDCLRSARLAGSRDAYFVMTCGSDIGDATAHNEALCRALGLRHRGTIPVVMPENYIALFDAPSPQRAKEIMDAVPPVLEEIVRAVQSDRDYFIGKPSGADKLKSGPINQGFYRFYISAKKFFSLEQCVGCGKCEALCPLNNIRLVNGRPLWGEHCTHCMACICSCPVEAIEYGKTSRGKRRYLAPEAP